LSLVQASSKHRRVISHLHFTDWPDHGVPHDPKNFLEFLEELESARQTVSLRHGQEVQPVVVHCTAGVGRTGVVILTDLMIACLQSNQRINILKSLIHLRCQRMLLVANFGQYRFVYTTLIHFIKNSRLIWVVSGSWPRYWYAVWTVSTLKPRCSDVLKRLAQYCGQQDSHSKSSFLSSKSW